MRKIEINPITHDFDFVGGGDIINNYGVAWNDENPMEGHWIQKRALPDASEAEFGKVYQYVGETTVEYTHGYFYECVERGGVYSWQRVNVQPSGSVQGGYVPMPRVTTIPADGNYLPGTLYVLTLDGTARTINLVPGESDKVAEYHMILSIGATAPTITWPSGLTWADDAAPTIKPSHVYELNILDGRAFCKDWGAAA